MKEKIRTRNSGYKILPFVFALFFALCQLFTAAEARVYIDITSPSLRKLPTALAEFSGASGPEISAIVRDDLDFTGIFAILDKGLHIESSEQAFNLKNWTVIGAEIVIKGKVKKQQDTITAEIVLYDVIEDREAFKKEYHTEASLMRPLAHAIANDIYKQVTNENGIFRTRIAYVIRNGSYDELALMDWDGQRVVKTGSKGSVLLSPRWSADGLNLIYSAERNRQWKIYMLNFAKMTEKEIFASSGTNLAGDFLTGSNDIVMASSMGGHLNLYSYSISNAKLSRLTRSRGIDVSPSVSPDGNQIAFVSDRDGTPQIFITDKNGYYSRRLTFNGSYNTSPSWSRTGDKIVFSGRQNGRNQIFVINPDGSGLTQLTEHGNNEDPSFSPDGRFIVFTSDRGKDKGLYIMRADGSAQKRITSDSVRAFGPRWSPK